MEVQHVLLFTLLIGVCHCETLKAKCDVAADTGTGDSAPVTGSITLSDDGTTTTIKVSLTGFTDNNTHGFHIHTTGNMSQSCSASGGHYNPENKVHAAPTATERHVGDLGNVQVMNYGVETTITDTLVKLSGDHSVIGRAFVIHAGKDDLGLGGDEGSLATGNAGARIGCCIIEADEDGTSNASNMAASVFLVISTLFVALKG